MANKSVDSNALPHGACPTCAEAAQAHSNNATPTTAALAMAAEKAARCLSLASKVCDHVAELSIAIQGYLALERLVEPTHADETQTSVAPPRIELAALVCALNEKVLRHIHALEVATTVLQAEMSRLGEAQAL